MKKIALIFPGIGYNPDKPLLYYAAKLAKNNGFEIINIDYGALPSKSGMRGNDAKMREAFAAACRHVEEQLNAIDFATYGEVLFISKSIGTAVAATAANRLGIPARQIYYTPVEQAYEQIGSEGIAFSGTADPWVHPEKIRKMSASHGLLLYVVEDANHSLETGDVLRDIQNLEGIMKITAEYIASAQ